MIFEIDCSLTMSSEIWEISGYSLSSLFRQVMPSISLCLGSEEHSSTATEQVNDFVYFVLRQLIWLSLYSEINIRDVCFVTVFPQRVSPCCFHTWLLRVSFHSN